MKKPPDSSSHHLTVKELSRRLRCPYAGKGSTRIYGVSDLEKAKPGDLVFLAHRKYRPLLEKSKASAAIIPADEEHEKVPVIKSENPYLTFIKAVELFYTPYQMKPGFHPQAFISPSAKIGKGAAVGAFSYIGDDVEIGEKTQIFPHVCILSRAKIGKESVIHSRVSIREDVIIGNRVIIHDGVVVGSDGFGYIKAEDGSHVKIPQKGTVVIEDDVEVGANTTIDRASLGETVIRKGTKIDNLVQIAHNVEIGENSILAAQTGIAGSTKIGRNVIMGGQVGVSDHVTIGDNVVAAAKSGITKSIPPGAMVSGSPHLDIRDWRKVWVLLPKLYDLVKDIKKLKKKVEQLEK
ncbi:MAG: UDP-3-O-(3-hydroxymyristoyl)glucosamine N-acyltransferase [Candidatus Aminicenantes bacterium]